MLFRSNGDPLSGRTYEVPANRPPVWLPPNDWESSARDAIEHEKYDNQPDWSLAHTLYRLEGFNGYGYYQHGVNSPYLWSSSNHFTKGKYTSDHGYDSEAGSQQMGAAVMLKVMANKGIVAFTV